MSPADKPPPKKDRIYIRVTEEQRKLLDEAVQALRDDPENDGEEVDLSSYVRSAALARARHELAGRKDAAESARTKRRK